MSSHGKFAASSEKHLCGGLFVDALLPITRGRHSVAQKQELTIASRRLRTQFPIVPGCASCY
jgi:hypothetical protein